MGSNGMFDVGNVNVAAPYFISGRTGALVGLTTPAIVARLVQFGMTDPRDPAAPLVPTPIRISQIRMRFLPLTFPATDGAAFEVLKGSAPSQPDTGVGLAVHAPQRRKTSSYPAISALETSLAVAGGVVAISGGGAFTPLDASGPIDMLVAGTVPGSSVWEPSDMCGMTLEAGEALEVRCVDLTDSGILLVAFDFLR